MTTKIENGLELFVRLNPRPELTGIWPELIKNMGPSPNDVIEINGPSSTGKTTFVLELILRTILPQTYNSIEINGKNTSAIFIDTDHHFNMFRFVRMIELKLIGCGFTSAEDIQNVIMKSLEKLIMCNVFNLTELHATVHKLSDMIHKNSNIGVICLDNIGSFYWSVRDFSDQTLAKDRYRLDILKLILGEIYDYGIVFIYTRQSGFKSSKNLYDNDVDKKIRLFYKIELSCNNLESDLYNAKVSYDAETYIVPYKLTNEIQLQIPDES